MRLFIAIPCKWQEDFAVAQKRASEFSKCKPVEPENFHMTLKFLGDVEGEKVAEICSAVNSAVSGTTPFDISLKGIGVFPSRNYVRVVWVGVDEGSEKLTELSKKIDLELKPLGFKKEKQFHPHFTLARVRFVDDKKGLAGLIDEYSKKEFSRFNVNGIKLMKSTLTPKGPVYEVVREFGF